MDTSKTPFSNKCEILGELWLYYRDQIQQDENWVEFFAWADVALPLAFSLWQGYATGTNDDGKQFINESFATFCELINIDYREKWEGLAECWQASPNDRHIEIMDIDL
jgi:hypothetical protein